MPVSHLYIFFGEMSVSLRFGFFLLWHCSSSKTADFSILTLYLASLLSSFNSLNSLVGDLFVYLYIRLSSTPTNRDIFTSFPIWIPFILFYFIFNF